MYDIIIIGAGPAGLTAAIYARRANKTVLLLEKGAFGGQITFSPKVENYPGFDSLSGTELADQAIITSDNPRTEDPEAIIRDITPGADQTGKRYEVVVDRREAIRHAMSIAKKDDIIVLAGKGHETYQEIMGVKHHMDEREIVAEILEEKKG